MRNRLLDPRPRDGVHWPNRPGVALAAAALAACAPVASQSPPPSEGVVAVVNLQSVTQAALADASRLTGVARGKLEVIEARAVNWQNGSIGCPEEGMAYTDALVPGYRVQIQAGERRLDYHASSRGGPVLCPEGRAMDPLPADAQF